MKYKFINPNEYLKDLKEENDNFFSKIIRIYRNSLDLLFIVSSLFFIFWSLSFFIPWAILKYILIVIVFFLYFTQEYEYLIKNEMILKFSKSFLKTIKISGGIIVIFLFLNSYLKIIDFLNQQFLEILSEPENLLNITILAILFIIFFMLSYAHFFVIMRDFIYKKLKGLIAVIAEMIIFFLPLFFLIAREEIVYFSFSFSEIIYSNLNWLIGFSLIFLHLNYLIKKVIIFFKSRESEMSI